MNALYICAVPVEKLRELQPYLPSVWHLGTEASIFSDAVSLFTQALWLYPNQPSTCPVPCFLPRQILHRRSQLRLSGHTECLTLATYPLLLSLNTLRAAGFSLQPRVEFHSHRSVLSRHICSARPRLPAREPIGMPVCSIWSVSRQSSRYHLRGLTLSVRSYSEPTLDKPAVFWSVFST